MSEPRFLAIIEATPVPMALNDDAQRIIFLNPAFIQTFGYDRADIPTISDWWVKAYPELDYRQWVIETWQAELARSRQTGTAFIPMEVRILCKDGTQRFAVVNAAPLSASVADISIVVLHDITDRRIAENALRDSEARYRRAERGTNDGLWEWVIATSEAYFSPRWLGMLGFQVGELPGHLDTFLDLIHPDDKVSYERAVERHFQNREPLDLEMRMRCKDDTHLWVLTRGDAERDTAGKPTRITGTITDITERKVAEVMMREREFQLNQAQRIAKVGSWDLNLESSTLRWSEEIFRLFEIDATKFGADYDSFLEAVHPEDRDAVNTAYVESLRTRQPYRIIHRLQMPDGRIKYVEEQCETDFAPDGTPLRSKGTVLDVTERELAAEEIRRSLREKEILLREIHHRVKNNLQIIHSLLYFQTKKVQDTAAIGVFNEVRDRLRSMILVHEKLYISRDLTDVDFADYVRSLVEQLRLSISTPGQAIRVLVEVAPVRLPIETALPCGMLLTELITNVLKYAFPHVPNGEMFVGLTEADGRVSLVVADDGVGLPATFDSETGQSFGWHLIRGLATQLDGAITIERKVGTRVTVSFPQRIGAPA